VTLYPSTRGQLSVTEIGPVRASLAVLPPLFSN
jgi:hypothetical protein